MTDYQVRTLNDTLNEMYEKIIANQNTMCWALSTILEKLKNIEEKCLADK